MSFTDRKPFAMSAELIKARERNRRRSTCCQICGRNLAIGDIARWIYANGTPNQGTGNFFVCEACDGPDADVLAKGKTSFQQAVQLAKQWDIYGPDWARDTQ